MDENENTKRKNEKIILKKMRKKSKNENIFFDYKKKTQNFIEHSLKKKPNFSKNNFSLFESNKKLK